ncbi:MAG: metal ABC transporter permease [Chloroflexi bacterium]|nr:metal ABC transporter permease [Chloroflexota bacterium]
MPEVLQYSFMQRALLAGLIVAVICPSLGLFLVLRRLSLMADTLSHVALAGVTIGIITKVFPPATALASSVVAAATIEALRAKGRLQGEIALALILYTALAVAVLLLGLGQGFTVDLFGYLFGNILTVSPADLWLITGLAVVILAFLLAYYRELVQSTLDPEMAHVSGVPVTRVNLLLAVFTGAAVTLAMRITGVLLVGALLVIPVIASLQLAKGFPGALALAVALGLLSVIGGLIAAFYLDLAAGATIVLIAVGILMLAFLARRLRSAFARRAPTPGSA